MDNAQFRKTLIEILTDLKGIPYETEKDFGKNWTGKGKWLDLTKPPKSLDCSGLTTGAYKKAGLPILDGAQKQFDLTFNTDDPKPGDFAFFSKGRDPNGIYHVGLIYDDTFMIEARKLDSNAHFKTGCVILRERSFWEKSPSFLGYRVHPDLRS